MNFLFFLILLFAGEKGIGKGFEVSFCEFMLHCETMLKRAEFGRDLMKGDGGKRP